MQCKFGTKEEDSYILQFKDFVYYAGLLTYGLQSTVDSKFEKGELMAISGEGFLTYKRDKKSLEFYSRPSNLGDINSSYSLYESQDYIKRVQADYDSYNGYYHINIADEVKYLKRYKFDTSKDKRKLTIADEFFVHSSFDGSKNFRFTNKMVYENGTEAYLCQKRGDELEGSGATISPLIEAIDTYEVTDEYPLQSQRWLLIYGPLAQDDNEDDDGAGSYYTEEDDDTVGKNGYGAILLPEYNQPKVQILPPNDVSYYKAEYFFYQNNNYMVYHKQSYNHNDHVKIDIFWRNGDVYQNLKLKLHNCYDHSYAKIILSPSGRYIFYVEEDKDDPEISWGKTVELSLNPETKEFYLKEVSKMDFTKAYEKKASDVNTYDYYGGTELYLTDRKELIYIHKSEGIIKFDAQQVDKKQFEGKFGKDPYDNTRDRTLNDVNVRAKNGGVAVYTEEECWFIRYDSREKKIYPMERINFQINKGQMTINQIWACLDPNSVVIDFIKDYTHHLILVWNIVDNKETQNFSTSKTFYHINGYRSKAGFILNGDTYVNLDTGLINYFFEYDFVNQGMYEQKGGLRISKNEDLVLDYGWVITKETLIEVYSLEDIVRYDDHITEDNISLERIRFQVDGSTSLHYYALEYDTLKLILDYMETHRHEYLTGILMKNNRGKSPLDITLDNESPKNTELLLRKLSLFSNSSLSALFYDRFNELLSMSITAFHEYLDSCYFQTIQMKNIKYLKLKDQSDPLLVPHSSCLIDEVFIDKYWDTKEKKELEEAKKKKEQEDKEREEQKAKQEEQNQLPENEKEQEDDIDGNKNSIVDKDSEDEMLNEIAVAKPKTKEELEKEKERRKQKRLDIRAIEFDWIFNKNEGVDFLRTLYNIEGTELFSLTLVRHIIRFLWSYYRTYIVIFLFIPYMVYITLFVLYSTWIHKSKVDDGAGEWEGYGLANTLSVICIMLFILYFFYYEVRQILFHKLDYFMSFWNMVDLVSLILNSTICIWDVAGLNEQDLNVLMSWAVLFMWLKVFYFGRIFKSTAALITMVIEITINMQSFLFVFILSVAGFGNCFMIMARNYGTDDPFTGHTYWRAFIYSYNQAMGNFDTSAYVDDDKYYLFLIWFLNTMVTLIIFLNLLIAIMGDIFDRVQEAQENNTLKEFAGIMIENELLLNRKKVFKDSKYIIVIQEEKADESTASWEGRLQYLKKTMDRAVLQQKKLLDNLEKSISSTIKEKTEKRAKDLESGAQKYFTMIFEKADIIQNLLKRDEEEKEE